VEGVTHPDAEARVVLRENLRYIIIRDKLLLVELSEHPFSEGLFNGFEDYLGEPGECTVFPVAICQESVKVRVRYLQPCTWLCQDAAPVGGWFNASPAVCTSGTEEDSIEFAIVLKEHPQAFGDSKDCVTMGHVLNYFAIEMLCELHCPLGSA
jgi:hypothetical protein